MPETFDKKQLHEVIIAALEALVDNAKNAVMRAYETATHEENIAENKYDTLGLEAAYLTQGQARRLAECETDLAAFQNLAPRQFAEDEAIAIGALVRLEDEAGAERYVFLGPAAGGLKISFSDIDIVVITPSAPFGKALLKAIVGDAVTVQLAAKQQSYDIDAVF